MRKTTGHLPAWPQGQGLDRGINKAGERSSGTPGGQAQRGLAGGCRLPFRSPKEGAMRGLDPKAAVNQLTD